MRSAIIRVIFITPKIDFSIQTKLGLEKLGGFKVIPFSSAGNALEYLRDHKMDIAVIDMSPPDRTWVKVLGEITKSQQDIRIIAGPDLPEVASLVADANAEKVIPIPLAVRTLADIIRDVSAGEESELADTASISPTPVQAEMPKPESNDLPAQEETPPGSSQSVEVILSEDDGSVLSITSDAKPVNENEDEESRLLFEKLAAEEPPLPESETGGTVSDLIRSGVEQPKQEEPTDSQESVEKVAPKSGEDDVGSNTATKILEATQDYSDIIGEFSVETFLDRVDQSLGENEYKIQPLPSWSKPEQVDEAGTNKESFDDLDSFIDSLGFFPAVESSQISEQLQRDMVDLADLPGAQFEFSELAIVEEFSDDGDSAEYELPEQESDEKEDSGIFFDEEIRDVYIAQLALTLTQVSLDLSTEATLLTRGNEILAYSGNLSSGDMNEIRTAIHNDWNVSERQLRVRFINLPDKNAEYMLYSQRTDRDLVLSLIFAGQTPVKAIREQSTRLLEALQAVPEAISANWSDIEIDPVVSRSPYTYVWFMRESDMPLDSMTALRLRIRLGRELARNQWDVHAVELSQSFVYVYADIPETVDVQDAVNKLKDLSRQQWQEIDPAIPDDVWSDGYLFLSPGRQISTDEIFEYADFLQN